jgi:hypothetical protein
MRPIGMLGLKMNPILFWALFPLWVLVACVMAIVQLVELFQGR